MHYHQVEHDITSITSLNFVKLKRLRKLALDINHFIPKELDYLFIHIVYGEEQDKQQELYYEFDPETRIFSPNTVNTARQQQIDLGRSHSLTIHFNEELEEFLLTGYISVGSCVTVYARFTNSELQPKKGESQTFDWLDYRGF